MAASDSSVVLSRVVGRALDAGAASERDLPSPAVLASLIEDATPDAIRSNIDSCVNTFKKETEKQRKERAALLLLDILSASQSRLPADFQNDLLTQIVHPILAGRPGVSLLAPLGDLVLRLLRSDSTRASVEKFLVSMLINVFGTPDEKEDAVSDVHPEVAAEVLYRVSVSLGASDVSFIESISNALLHNVLNSVSENSNDKRRFLTQRFLASFYDAFINHLTLEQSKTMIKKTWETISALYNRLESYKPDIYGVLAALYDHFMCERSLYVPVSTARKEDDDEEWVVKQQQLDKKNKAKAQAQQKKGGSTPSAAPYSPLHDLRLESSFFDMILSGLADHQDPLVRKRALYLLKRCIESSKRLQADTKSQPQSWPIMFNWDPKKATQLSRAWHSFFLILETLQEYDIHIIKPVWAHIKVLHADQNNPAPLNDAWKNLILRLGFSHKNSLVKKYCILSYMSLFSAPQYLRALDQETMLNFIDLAADPTVFSVAAGQKEHTPKKIFSAYLSSYIAALPEASGSEDPRSSFVNNLLSRALKQSFPPALMESILASFASLETSTKALNNATFATLAAIVQSNIPLFHFRHHRAVYASAIQSLLKMSDISSIPYDQVRRFVRSIPAAHRKVSHAQMQQWLASFGDGWLEKNLIAEIEAFPDQISSASATLSSADVDDAYAAAAQLVDLFIYVSSESLSNLSKKVLTLNSPLCFASEQKAVRKIVLLSSLLRFLRSAATNEVSTVFSTLSIDSILEESLKFRSGSQLLSQPSGGDLVCSSLNEYDLYEAEGRLFAVGCEIAAHLSVLQSISASSASSTSPFQRIIINLSQDLSNHIAITTPSVVTELRGYTSILALSKIFNDSILSSSNDFDAKSLGQLLQSLIGASIRTVNPSVGDHADARQRLKKLASSESLLIKWKTLAAAIKLALRISDASVALASARQMIQVCIDALPIASDQSITQVAHCIRFLIRAIAHNEGGYSAITPPQAQSWLKSIWNAFKQFKDFSSRRVSQFNSIAFSPVFLTSTDVDIVATLKGYFTQLVSIGDAAMGVMNSVALRFTRAFKDPNVGFKSLDANWIPELALLLVYGVDRKGQTEGSGDARFDTGYGGPQQDFYSRSLANSLVLDISAKAKAGDALACSIIDKLFNRLVLMSQNDPDVKGSDLAKNTHPHRKVTRCWQTLSICAHSVSREAYEKVSEWIWEQFKDVPQSSIRDAITCCLAVLFGRFPDAANPHLLKVLQWDNLVISHQEVKTAKEDAIFSALSLAGGMIAHPVLLSSRPEIFKSLLDCAIPYLTINTLFLRGCAHEVIRTIFATSENEAAFLSRVGPQVHALLKQLDSIIQVQSGIVTDLKKRRREGLVENVSRLLSYSACAKTDSTLIDICRVVFVEQPTTSQIEASEIVDLAYTFDSYEAVKRKCRNLDSQQRNDEDLAAAIVAERGNKTALEGHMTELDLIVSSEVEQQNYQKKIIPWQQMNINSISDDSGEELNEATKRPRQDIIIVATMLKKAANLGGLTRTAEIFQASQLVIPSKMVLQDKVYQQLCVTADQWVPMVEVPESSLKEYLISKKAEGYSLLGAEQTADSVQLTAVDWPQKTVLVLGDERTGIPAQFIHLLDRCVEIPQLGVVRSLNVHVTGSIMLWEYSRQHAFS